MVENNTTEYYQRRQIQESKLAEKAMDPSVAKIHRDLASRYGVLADTSLDQTKVTQPINLRIV